MKNIYTLLLVSFTGLASKPAGHPIYPDSGLDDCDKVQTLLTILDEFKGPPINDSTFSCKDAYLLEGFNGARVIVPGHEAKYWTVNMDTEAMPQTEAEAKYLGLIKQLMKCDYLNSWKAGETTRSENVYHFSLKQTISNTGYYKNILISYYKLSNTELYKVEIALIN